MQTLIPVEQHLSPKEGDTLIFLHANGFPPATYSALLAPLAQRYKVFAVEHRPLWGGEAPTFFGWDRYANDLAETLNGVEEPVWLLGHSMGAVIAMLYTLKNPSRIKGLIAFDPVILRPHIWFMGKFLQRFNANALPIVKVALKRPHTFQSFEAAFSFYRTKRVFQRLSDAVLHDYVHAAHQPVDGHGVALRYSGAWEACVYRSAPLMWFKLKKLKVPVLGIVGDQSDVIGKETLKHWHDSTVDTTVEVQHAGHLVPLELPDYCAQRAIDFIELNNQKIKS